MTTAMPLAAQDYPLLNLFWTMLELFVWVLWFFLLFRIIIDIFRSHDLGGWGKALWLIFVIVLPFLGVIIYLIARGGSMAQRDARQAQDADAATRSYIQSATGASTSTADEVTKLASLRDQGVITDAEFAAQKAKVLG
jgi:ABC-type multidrug transport system fused ATPase/permease subunit